MSQDEINQSEWEKPENWSLFGGAYKSRLDNRLFVPRRGGSGVTMNLGRKSSNIYILGFLAVLLLPLIFALVGMAIKGQLF